MEGKESVLEEVGGVGHAGDDGLLDEVLGGLREEIRGRGDALLLGSEMRRRKGWIGKGNRERGTQRRTGMGDQASWARCLR